jgi:hypothetical protein
VSQTLLPAGDIIPRWDRRGLPIFYFEAAGHRGMSADVNGSRQTFRVRAVRPLFTVRPAAPRALFDVLAVDEPRFLVNTLLGQTTCNDPSKAESTHGFAGGNMGVHPVF